MEPWKVIKELESDNSRLFKENVIAREAKQGNDIFFEGVRLALDCTITFGIKKVPEKKSSDPQTSKSGLDWDSFSLMLTGFVNREITGNLARDTIDHLMKAATVEQWNDWYRRILIKDLRCGVSEKTINNVVKKNQTDYQVPVFGCQLAHDSANHETKVSGKKLLEVKLDGVRVITIVYPTGRVDQFSRNGKELVNFPHIKEQFAKTVTGITEPVVFDGEVMSGSFQDLMKQVHRKSDVQAGDAVLHLFDFLPLVDFDKGFWDRRQIDRSEKLRAWKDLWNKETPSIQILDHEEVDLDTPEGKKKFKEINQRAIDGGYEGIMIKDPEAPYECKRSVAWLKLKPFIEVSLTVVDTEEGTGKNQGKMGALVCEGIDDGKTIRVNVGSGFTDQQREEFWSCRADGFMVEVRADAITQNQDGTYSLRFPRFQRFRGFEVNEKI